MRILTILLACFILHSCTNTETPTDTSNTVEDNIKSTETTTDSSTSEITVPDEPTEQTTTNSNSKVKKDEKNHLLSTAELDALRKMFDYNNGEEIEGFASDEDDTTKVTITYGAFDEVISAKKSGEDITDEVVFGDGSSNINKKSIEYIRRPKPIVDFTGYKIELITVYNRSLELDDQLFKTFGHLMFKHNTTNSTTYYLGEFDDKDQLEDYLQKVVKSRFPKAKGVKFKNGLKVKYN